MTVIQQSASTICVEHHASDLLDIPHGMFCRKRGASPQPFKSLNLSYGVGDVAANVVENRQRIKNSLKLQFLVSAVQIHSDSVTAVEDITKDMEIPDHDALITSQPGVGLLIQQADCQAVLFHDPVKRIIAATHCGWRGSVLNIIGKTVAAMQQMYGSKPSDLLAVVSPSLGPCCAEFVNYRRELPLSLHRWQVRPDYFDFWAISHSQLRDAGLRPDRIEISGICTMCNKDFFSYRRAVHNGSPVTGRNGSVIALPR